MGRDQPDQAPFYRLLATVVTHEPNAVSTRRRRRSVRPPGGNAPPRNSRTRRPPGVVLVGQAGDCRNLDHAPWETTRARPFSGSRRASAWNNSASPVRYGAVAPPSRAARAYCAAALLPVRLVRDLLGQRSQCGSLLVYREAHRDRRLEGTSDRASDNEFVGLH